MGFLDALGGGISYLNEEREKEKERQRVAQAGQLQFLQQLLSKNYSTNTPTANVSLFNQMMDMSQLPPEMREQQKSQFGQTIEAEQAYNPFPSEPEPIPTDTKPIGAMLGAEPYVPKPNLSPSKEKLWQLQKAYMTPNLPQSERVRLNTEMASVKSSMALEEDKAFQKRQMISEGLTGLQGAGASPDEQQDYLFSVYGGRFKPGSSMFVGTSMPYQMILPDGSSVPVTYNSKTEELKDQLGNPIQLPTGATLSRIPFDRWQSATDITGRVSGYSPLRGASSVRTIGNIGREGAYISPEAADAFLEGSGGSVNTALPNVPGAVGKAQLARRAAEQKDKFLNQPGVTPENAGTFGFSSGNPDFTPPLTPQAAGSVTQIDGSLAEMNNVLKKLRSFSPDDPDARLTLDAIAYALGFNTENSGLIADLNRVEVLGGSAYMSAVKVRAIQTLKQVQVHLAKPSIDQKSLALSKMTEAIRALQSLRIVAIKLGAKNITQGGAGASAIPPPPSGDSIRVKNPQGKTGSYPRMKWEANRDQMEKDGWQLAQ